MNDFFDIKLDSLKNNESKIKKIKRKIFNYRIYEKDIKIRDFIVMYNLYELKKPYYNNNSFFEDGIEELKKEFGDLDKYNELPKPFSKKNRNGELCLASSGGLVESDFNYYIKYLNFKQDILQNRFYFSADFIHDITELLRKKYNLDSYINKK